MHYRTIFVTVWKYQPNNSLFGFIDIGNEWRAIYESTLILNAEQPCNVQILTFSFPMSLLEMRTMVMERHVTTPQMKTIICYSSKHLNREFTANDLSLLCAEYGAKLILYHEDNFNKNSPSATKLFQTVISLVNGTLPPSSITM